MPGTRYDCKRPSTGGMIIRVPWVCGIIFRQLRAVDYFQSSYAMACDDSSLKLIPKIHEHLTGVLKQLQRQHTDQCMCALHPLRQLSSGASYCQLSARSALSQASDWRSETVARCLSLCIGRKIFVSQRNIETHLVNYAA